MRAALSMPIAFALSLATGCWSTRTCLTDGDCGAGAHRAGAGQCREGCLTDLNCSYGTYCAADGACR
jgi:hypothetical protein